MSPASREPLMSMPVVSKGRGVMTGTAVPESTGKER